jgi:hypothetical protein
LILVVVSFIVTVCIVEYFDLRNYILYDKHVSIYGVYRKIKEKLTGDKK